MTTDVPQNAPESCPGTSSSEAGKAAACAGCPNQAACASTPKTADPDMAAIAERMKQVKHVILVLSGKGGVGKSTFSSQLAFSLAAEGKEVGLLDIDICGPSIPKMLGLEGQEVHQSNLGWSPVYVEDSLAVMSIGFMLPDPNEAVIWRGPRKNSLIKQFLKDVHWGPLDYLVVDAPPGTSDEHITIAQCLRGGAADGSAGAAGASGSAARGGVSAVIVTTPQQVSIIDVRKEISFCKKVGLPILGVVENMSGLQQRLPLVRFQLEPPPSSSSPSPSSSGPEDVTARVLAALQRELGPEDAARLLVCTDVFEGAGGGAERMCREVGVPLLGRVPLDPALGQAAERGASVFEHVQAAAAAEALPAADGEQLVAADGAKDSAAVAVPPVCVAALRSIVAKISAACDAAA